MFPASAILNGETRALLAVLGGARTVREVAQRCGWSSPSTAHEHLRALRTRGLVAWEPGTFRTLHPLVEEVER